MSPLRLFLAGLLTSAASLAPAYAQAQAVQPSVEIHLDVLADLQKQTPGATAPVVSDLPSMARSKPATRLVWQEGPKGQILPEKSASTVSRVAALPPAPRAKTPEPEAKKLPAVALLEPEPEEASPVETYVASQPENPVSSPSTDQRAETPPPAPETPVEPKLAALPPAKPESTEKTEIAELPPQSKKSPEQDKGEQFSQWVKSWFEPKSDTEDASTASAPDKNDGAGGSILAEKPLPDEKLLEVTAQQDGDAPGKLPLDEAPAKPVIVSRNESKKPKPALLADNTSRPEKALPEPAAAKPVVLSRNAQEVPAVVEEKFAAEPAKSADKIPDPDRLSPSESPSALKAEMINHAEAARAEAFARAELSDPPQEIMLAHAGEPAAASVVPVATASTPPVSQETPRVETKAPALKAMPSTVQKVAVQPVKQKELLSPSAAEAPSAASLANATPGAPVLLASAGDAPQGGMLDSVKGRFSEYFSKVEESVPAAVAKPTPKTEPAKPLPAAPAGLPSLSALTGEAPPPAPKPLPKVEAVSKSAAALTIPFSAAETSLPEFAKAQLNGIAEKLKADESQRATLMSYSSAVGEQGTATRRVSLSRALAVRNYLIDQGVSSMRVNVLAQGSKNAGEGQPDRVDVVLGAEAK